jgi:hypothetical protein
MSRNSLAGTKKGNSKSAKHYQSNPEAKEKKKRYDTQFNKSKKQKKKRVVLNRANREAGTYGNGDGKDMAHYKDKDGKLKMRQQDQSANRADKKKTFFRVKKKS